MILNLRRSLTFAIVAIAADLRLRLPGYWLAAARLQEQGGRLGHGQRLDAHRAKLDEPAVVPRPA